MRPFCVITTIFQPTLSIRLLNEKLIKDGCTLVVVGDRKGPLSYDLGTGMVHFMSLETQQNGPFELGRMLPTGHYSRKNIGYQHAIADGASLIYETDDDNAPSTEWYMREEIVRNARVIPAQFNKHPKWVNVYRYFSTENIWPRGLPLDEVSKKAPEPDLSMKDVCSPIQQGLVNNSPDVDAIWRLTQDRFFCFDKAPSVYLQPGNWSPFNTQSTWWWPPAYPLMYIPSHCPFRMCDIWKSLVAQRCLWELGYGVVFHAPEAIQDRNVHNLMQDFEDEIPGYLKNFGIAEILHNLKLKSGEGNALNNMVLCYEALVQKNIFPKIELPLVKAWVHDLENIQ